MSVPLHGGRSARNNSSAFTLIELLVVIAIIAILAVVVVLTLNPSELLKQSRDTTRVSDMDTLEHALSLYSEDQNGNGSFSMGTAKVIYVSIPDTVATSTAGDQCQGLGLPAIPSGSGYSYHCAASSTSRAIHGTGWIPVDLSAISSGAPLGSLPVDPINTSSSREYYTYTTDGNGAFELTAVMESLKYNLGGSNDVVSGDGGQLASLYEKGTRVGLEPMDYGDPSLILFWPLNEGTGTAAYDMSGSNMIGTWAGALNNGITYYTSGNVGPYAGWFNGSNDKVYHSNINAFNFGTGDYSISMWLNPQGTWSSITEGIVGQKANDTSPGFQIYHDSNDTTQIRFRSGDSSTKIDVKSTVGSVVPGQWTYVVAERQNGVGYLYINGVQNASTTNTLDVSGSSANFNVGYADTWGANYHGYLDDLRVYNRALSSAEIAAMYRGQK